MPVTTMARAAQAISGEQVDRRLPVAQTADEIEELGRSINGLLDRLQDSFKRQRRFTGDASHQLRTPLTAIQGQVDVALRQDRTVEEYRRVLAVVQRRTRHLSQIVESLLFLARASNETLAPHLEPVDLAEWLDNHLKTWKESHGGVDLQIEITSGGPFPVQVQPALLAELVTNLLDNAASGTVSPVRRSRCRSTVGAARSSLRSRTGGSVSPRTSFPICLSHSIALRKPDGEGLRGWDSGCRSRPGSPLHSAGPSM